MNKFWLYIIILIFAIGQSVNGYCKDKESAKYILRMTDPDGYIAPTLKLGYTPFFNRNFAHLFELGYYHMIDYGLFSYGPSVSAVGKLQNGRFVVGPKLGIEASLIMLDAKLDLIYLHPGFYVHPSIGISILNKAGIMFGYNICTNQSKSSGFTIGLYYHISPTRKNGLNSWN